MPKQTGSLEPEFDPIDDIIPPADEVEAAIRSVDLGATYKEKECDAASAEQLPLHKAKAEEAAQPFDRTAASLKRQRKSASLDLKLAEKSAKKAEKASGRANFELSPYVDRPSHAKAWYLVRLIGLLVGDVAAASGAMLLLGESYGNAVGQALSVAVAAVTLGAIGSDVKRQRQTRAFAKTSAEESLSEFDALFRGRNDGDRVVQRVVAVAFLGLSFITVGIFTLRAATEGSAAAWTFGAFAFAIGFGSFVNSYTTTCAFGEYLDRLRARVAECRAILTACQTNSAIAQHDGALAEAASVRAIWAARGQAAWIARQREKFAILNANPRAVGNGWASAAVVAQDADVEVDIEPLGDEDAA